MMTIEQFKNKYKGQNIDIKNFDVLYKIGVDYKTSISIKDKNYFTWKDLTAFLGIDFMTGEQYRLWVVNQQRKDGTLSFRGTNEKIVPAQVTPVIDREKYKDTTRIRDEMNLYRKSLRDEARIEGLEHAIVTLAKELPALKYPVTKTSQLNNGAEGILMLCDWHIGQDCDNFYNKYNLDIAAKRIAKVISNTIDYCHKLNITTLHVLNLGDLIEGKINLTGRVDSNEKTIKQLMFATELMAKCLAQLEAAIPVVTYRSVTDNHSSIDSNFKERFPGDNLNLLTTWYLQARLTSNKIIFKNDNLDIGLGRFTLKNGMKVAFFHGHEDPKDKTLQNLVGATHEWTDIVCCGHWHNPAEHVYQDMRLFIGGSLCGTGPYALSHRMFTKPSQKLIVIHNNNFLNLDISATD